MNRRLLYLTSLVFGLLLFLSSAIHAKSDQSSVEMKVRSAVESIAKKRNIPSVALSISTGQESFQFDYHHPDLLEQEIYGIGSTTKLLSALLVLHYAEQGKLGLNENVTKYVRDANVLGINGIENITVLQLLRHESGLSDYANNSVWSKRVSENKAPASFDEKLELVDSKLGGFGKFSYSNTNYLFLEKIIEQVSGLSFSEAFNRYYKSLGLDITIGSSNNDLQAYFAQTEKASSNVSSLQEHYGFDGGAYTIPSQLQKLFAMLFAKNAILSKESIGLMQRWHSMAPTEIPIGSGKITKYGAGIMRLTYQDESLVGHMGSTLKYQSFAFFRPVDKTGIVLFTNASGRHYNNAFFQELVPAVLDEL